MKRENKSIRHTKCLVAAALLSALSFVFMYIGTLTGVMDLCAVVVGALCCAFAVVELRGVWPWLLCTVTGALCLIMLPDKFIALEYITLGGLYPILKAFFERLPKLPSWVLKITVFNVMLTACLLLAKFVLSVPSDEIGFSIIVYLVGNAYFIFYDYALTVFISYYMVKLRHRMKIRF